MSAPSRRELGGAPSEGRAGDEAGDRRGADEGRGRGQLCSSGASAAVSLVVSVVGRRSAVQRGAPVRGASVRVGVAPPESASYTLGAIPGIVAIGWYRLGGTMWKHTHDEGEERAPSQWCGGAGRLHDVPVFVRFRPHVPIRNPQSTSTSTTPYESRPRPPPVPVSVTTHPPVACCQWARLVPTCLHAPLWACASALGVCRRGRVLDVHADLFAGPNRAPNVWRRARCGVVGHRAPGDSLRGHELSRHAECAAGLQAGSGVRPRRGRGAFRHPSPPVFRESARGVCRACGCGGAHAQGRVHRGAAAAHARTNMPDAEWAGGWKRACGVATGLCGVRRVAGAFCPAARITSTLPPRLAAAYARCYGLARFFSPTKRTAQGGWVLVARKVHGGEAKAGRGSSGTDWLTSNEAGLRPQFGKISRAKKRSMWVTIFHCASAAAHPGRAVGGAQHTREIFGTREALSAPALKLEELMKSVIRVGKEFAW
ncbi:hypothetical protein C8F04DRAFT_1188163 [Mycena alexandri]|uniref:Uncharacterized protein n=1 Tax=Mycena alexandri TaxID=1745969 RepID=A0AAD6SJX0_9AGAR|nr:hypothetical protein C8F04DRAFT_1188163 [Mycena alexandri]